MSNVSHPLGDRSRNALLMAALLAFTIPLFIMGIRHLRLDNQVESWLPANDSEATVFRWYQGHFPEEERVVITWNGSTLDDPRCEQLVSQLRGHVDADGLRRGGVPYLAAVVSARDILTRMVESGVPQAEAVTRLQGTLLGTGRIKIRLTDAGREQRARTITQLQKRVKQELGFTIQVFEPVTFDDAQSPTQEISSESTEASDAEAVESVVLDPLVIPNYDFELAWNEFSAEDPRVAKVQTLARDLRGFATAKEPQGRVLVDDCFMVPGSPVAIAGTLSEAGRADANSTIAAIRRAALQVGIPEEDLILGGGSVASIELNQSVARAAWNPSAPFWRLHERSVMLLSGLVGMLVASVSLRNVKLSLLVLGVAYYAAFVSTALVPLTGTSMSMVLVVLPILVIVVAITGAIHVTNYISHATRENPEGAVDRATRWALLPCCTSALTIVLGLLSLLRSSLVPVREFGIYASLGAGLTLFMGLVVLPALLKLFPTQTKKPPESDVRMWLGYSQFLMRFARPIQIACWTMGLIACAGLIDFRTETRVIRNFAEDTRLIRDTRFIEQNLAGNSAVETVIKFDPQSQKSLRFLQRMEVVRQVADKIRQHPHVSGAVCLADFQPVRTAPGESAGTREKVLYNRSSAEVEKRIMTAHSADTRSLLTIAPQSADLQRPGDQGLNSAGDELWRITAQVPSLADIHYGQLTEDLNQSVQSVTKYHAGVGHVVTGTAPLYMRTQQALLDGLIQSFRLACLVIAVVMMCSLKDVVSGALCMIPNVLPIVAVFGVACWSGTRIDIGMMITASVALGLAMNSCLHLLSWFRRSLESGLSREDAIVQCLVDCGPVMLQTMAGSSLAMLMLYPSDLVMISRFGWMMASLMAATYVGNIVLLPVMLRGILGSRMENALLAKRHQAALPEETLEQSAAPPVTELKFHREENLSASDAEIPAPHLPIDKARTRRKRQAG
jgi:uncharacterized protein